MTETLTERKPVTVYETPITLTEILTDQNDTEDIYIDDEDRRYNSRNLKDHIYRQSCST